MLIMAFMVSTGMLMAYMMYGIICNNSANPGVMSAYTALLMACDNSTDGATVELEQEVIGVRPNDGVAPPLLRSRLGGEPCGELFTQGLKIPRDLLIT